MLATNMGLLSGAILPLSWATLAVAAATTSDSMGPAAFMWPPDREWTAAQDNIAPCGSPAKAGNRTEFPLTNGPIALVDQDEGYDIKVSVSYSNEPTSNADFSVLVPSQNFKELLRGHTCITLPDPPRTVTAGANATLQIIYTADFDKPENQTFYACSDITYILESDFSTEINYCFNATEPSSDDGGSGTTTGGSGSPTTTSAPNTGGSSGGGGKKSLSGGAIAGIVIGSIAAVGIVGAAALWYYRRRQQQARIDAMTKSSRNVAWEHQAHGKDSTSQNSVRLQDM